MGEKGKKSPCNRKEGNGNTITKTPHNIILILDYIILDPIGIILNNKSS